MSPLIPGRSRERWRDVDRKRPGVGAWLRRLLLVAVLGYLAAFAWTGHLVGKAEGAYRAGRFDEAHEILSRAAFWRARVGRVNDGLGVVDLSRDRLEEAATHLSAARGGFFHPPAFGEKKVWTAFLRGGRYEQARIYAAHRLAIKSSPQTAFYLGVSENGLNRLDDAEKHLAQAATNASLKPRTDEQLTIIAAKRRTGRVDYLLDRTGAPLAGVDLRSGRRTLLVPELAPLLDGPFGPRLEPRDTTSRVRLTLDLELQRAAEAALGAQRGALVVIDITTGGLLAAASQPASMPAPGGVAPPALTRAYEPGSIMKMVTLMAALRKGVDVERMFPMECPGWILIDGVAYRDWMPHRRVESLDHAVAVSCNLAFGSLGQVVGRDALNAELRGFGFDFASETAAPASDFGYAIGALLPEDNARPNYALARRAVGLDSIQITPIGAALVAAGLARGGAPPIPHMIEDKTNILGERYHEHEPPAPGAGRADLLAVPQIALIARTMKAAVTGAGKAEGTARRAGIEGLPAAMKTGTSGNNPPGYDALVIGFVPADKPALAWALVAEHAGKAEIEGARITGEFLRRIRSRIP